VRCYPNIPNHSSTGAIQFLSLTLQHVTLRFASSSSASKPNAAISASRQAELWRPNKRGYPSKRTGKGQGSNRPPYALDLSRSFYLGIPFLFGRKVRLSRMQRWQRLASMRTNLKRIVRVTCLKSQRQKLYGTRWNYVWKYGVQRTLAGAVCWHSVDAMAKGKHFAVGASGWRVRSAGFLQSLSQS